MVHITLQDVSVDFPIFNAANRSLKKHFVRISSGGRIAQDADKRLCIQALSQVSLRLDHGDRLGLVGHNGAGKTTLLRVLAGIYEPSRGQIERTGRTVPLFDVALGMDMEGTGHENITLRGLFLGLTHAEIEAKRDEIATFTELGDYLSMPVRTYSTGMLLRLAFAICTTVVPDILLMDEWLSVGDAHFVERAERRLNDVIERSRILVLASHSPDLIRRVCNKAILMDQGAIRSVGNVDDVLSHYAAMG